VCVCVNTLWRPYAATAAIAVKMSLAGFLGLAWFDIVLASLGGLPADAIRWRSEKVQLKAQQCAPQDIQVGKRTTNPSTPPHHQPHQRICEFELLATELS